MNRRRSLAGVLALLVCVAAVRGCLTRGSTAGVADAPGAVSAPLPTSEPTSSGAGRSLTLAFAGDTHFQLNLASLLDHPRGALGPIARTLRDADLTMVNLESALTLRGALDPKELERPADRYWYRTSPTALDLLALAGVDVVTMANNHGVDYGPQGLADTLRAIRGGPLPVVGIGRDRAAAFAPYRVRIRGTDLAILAADTSPREGRSPTWAAGADHAGIAAARGSRTGALVAAVHDAGARGEVVVVYLHWGVEEHSCPSEGQRRLAAALAEAGADVIVGSHAHLQQGAGWLGDTYVDYGLGNFLWYHNHHPRTGVLRVDLVDGRVVSDAWAPAEIPLIGPPRPLHRAEASRAVARWRALRSCTGLAARPATPAPLDLRPGRGPAHPSGYAASVHRIGPSLRARLGAAHHPGCPLDWPRLRYLRLPYVGFDGHRHLGEMVVAARHARDVVTVFARLYAARWPLRGVRPASDFGGDDERSMAADNTSGYNCRRVAGSERWSAHARGAAIDLNPVENPYLLDDVVHPAAGRAFAGLDRSASGSLPPGAIRDGDVVVKAFEAIGWEWGGSWTDPDYQHFQAPRPATR